MGTPAVYDRTLWDPNFRGFLHLVEFAGTNWKKQITLDPPPDFATTLKEIQDLLSRATKERFAHLTDIVAQNGPPWVYFFRALSVAAGKEVNEKSYPRTFDLMYATAHSAAIVFFYKELFARPRPSHVDPRLTTAVPVPGHPAYPSGHSTQSHLVAFWLAELLPSAKDELLDVAEDITVNRERAGLHFPSDSQAGRELARQAFPIMRACAIFQQTFAEASTEWA